MKKPGVQAVVRILLKRYGRTFAQDLGIDAAANEPAPLFCLLASALLFSTRINHNVALKSARVLFDCGWTTPQRLAATTWEQRVQALDEGGYVRYDDRTSTRLGELAQSVVDRYGGDLRRLRETAGSDPARERQLLDEFKGIGEVGVNIFCREAQLAWRELFPFADGRVLASARKLGLPSQAAKLARLVPRRADFVRLVAALMRVQLERKQDQVLEEARRAG